MAYQKRRNGKKTPKKAAPGARMKATSARKGSGNRVVAKTPGNAPKRDLSRPMYRPIAVGCEYCGYAPQDGHAEGCPAQVSVQEMRDILRQGWERARINVPWWRRAWEWLMK